MSAYPFVRSFHDLGVRRGPVLGFVVHMAEGGGTVNFLAKQNAHGVSVHYVIERSGRIVQMLREDHMHTSIRTSAIRMDTESDGFYGRKAALAVLGRWADITTTLGPNHATIAVEIEGFAATGPNADQAKALVRLVNDVRSRFPDIGLLGHRDLNVKTCPGRLIDWPALGGHGPKETDMPGLVMRNVQRYVGEIEVVGPGHSAVQIATKTLVGLPDKARKVAYFTATLDPSLDEQLDNPKQAGDRSSVYVVGDEPAVILKVDVRELPETLLTKAQADAQTTAALDYVAGPAAAVITAIQEARP